MTFQVYPRSQQGSDCAAQLEFARAESDYRRLRQAYLELAQGEHNEVAMAMVGADMERANALLQTLGSPRPLPSAHEPVPGVEREAGRLAEENA